MNPQIKLYSREQIYADYYSKVLQYTRHHSNEYMDAEDLAQTVFLKVLGKLDTFDPEKSSLSTWIFNITRNTVIDHQRSMAFRQHGELSETLTDDSDDILDRLIMEDEQERLVDALEILDAEERELIILHYYSGQTLLSISELMGKPYGQVKRLHAKTLEKLRKQMGRENGRPRARRIQFKTPE